MRLHERVFDKAIDVANIAAGMVFAKYIYTRPFYLILNFNCIFSHVAYIAHIILYVYILLTYIYLPMHLISTFFANHSSTLQRRQKSAAKTYFSASKIFNQTQQQQRPSSFNCPCIVYRQCLLLCHSNHLITPFPSTLSYYKCTPFHSQLLSF